MGYINDLRQIVGNRPLIMVGATLLMVDQQQRLLMMKRTDNGCWGVPGGALEPGENLEQALQRETKEETGLDVQDLELFGVYSGSGQFYRYPNGDEVHNVSVAYLSRSVSGDLKINLQEHSEARYFHLAHLPVQISPPINVILSDLLSRWQQINHTIRI